MIMEDVKGNIKEKSSKTKVKSSKVKELSAHHLARFERIKSKKMSSYKLLNRPSDTLRFFG